MICGPNQENMTLIREKAKSKKDGAYTFRGVAYRVRNNRVTHIAYWDEVLECFGNFNVIVGKYSGYTDAAIKALKSI